MSELKLPSEDMAKIDRRFWAAVEEDRRVFQAFNGTPPALDVPDAVRVTDSCQLPDILL